MLILALVPPALAQPASNPPKFDSRLLEALEGIAEAYIGGEEAKIPALIQNARRHWEHCRRTSGSALTEEEVQLFTQNLEALPTLKPRHQAEAALKLAGGICGQMRPSAARAVLEADLATMLAWCRVEARHWETMPNVAEALRPLLERASGRHPGEARQVGECLELLREDLETRSVSGAKRDLRRLLDLIDILERP